MHDALKHTIGTAISGLGFIGSITLSQTDHIVSITCGVFGTLAALCTILSWWKHRKY